jgi:hypothetical protein
MFPDGRYNKPAPRRTLEKGSTAGPHAFIMWPCSSFNAQKIHCSELCYIFFTAQKRVQIMWWVIKMRIIYLSWWWPLPATPEHQMYQTTFYNNPGNYSHSTFGAPVARIMSGQVPWYYGPEQDNALVRDDTVGWQLACQNCSPKRKTCWMLLYPPKILGLNFGLHS